MRTTAICLSIVSSVFFSFSIIQGQDFTKGSAAKEQQEVTRLLKVISSDERRPTPENISGSWKPNPEILGPGDHFILTETAGKISGMGVFSGCVLEYTYKISGYRKNGMAILTFKSDGIASEIREEKFLITSNEHSALLAKVGFEKYPMVPGSFFREK